MRTFDNKHGGNNLEILQLILSGLSSGCIYGLIALGFVLIYKSTEAVNFAQGDMMMIGSLSIISLTSSTALGLSFIVAIPLMLILMALIGFLIEKVFITHITGESQIAIAILTIAIGFGLRFIAGVIWGYDPQMLESALIGNYYNFGELVISVSEVLVIITTLALTLFLYYFFAKTKIGVAMVAVSQNQLAAYYMGIPVKRMQSLTWIIAGLLAGVAGFLYSAKSSVDPITGLLGIKAFAAAVIGGFGSLPGALVGGLVVGLVEPFAARFLPVGYSHLMPYIILVMVLIFRPHGIFSQTYSKKV